MPATARLAIPYPALSSAADVPADMSALAAALDAVVDYRLGTRATRVANPGHQAVIHWSTDTHMFSFWDGSTWYDIGPSVVSPDSITAAMLAPDSVGSSELADNAVDTNAIQNNAVTSAKIADGTIVGADISATLKPSGGAAGSTEALRAIGAAVGMAAPGIHAPQHSLAGADPLPANSVGASQIQDGAIGTAELSAMPWLQTAPKATLRGSDIYHGDNYTIQAQHTGYYILEWGAPRAGGSHQGAFGNISCNRSGATAEFADVGMSGMPALQPDVYCGAGETIYFYVNGDNDQFYVFAPWAKLTRSG